jgi:hypothetical protein
MIDLLKEFTAEDAEGFAVVAEFFLCELLRDPPLPLRLKTLSAIQRCIMNRRKKDVRSKSNS